MANLRASVLTMVLLAPAAARAGVTITYDTRDDAGNPGIATMVFQGDRIRIEGVKQRENTGTAIIDAAAQKMIMIDSAKRKYHELTAADMKMMQERMAQARAMMQNLPPEQRKRIEQMMPGGNGPAVKYEPLGQKKTVAGYACETYRVSVGEQALSESCMASWTSGILSKAEVERLKQLAAKMKDVFEITKQMDFSKVPGIPVEEIHLAADGKTRTYTRTLKSITRGDVPASAFEAPAGFTKKSIPMMGGHR